MTLVGLLFALDAFAWDWAYSKEDLEQGHGGMCAPEVQRETLQNTVETVGVLLELETFAGQDKLKERFATIAGIENDERQRDAFLGLVGVSLQSGEDVLVAYSRFVGARDYSTYIDAIEKNVGTSLTPMQREEMSGVFENLKGRLE